MNFTNSFKISRRLLLIIAIGAAIWIFVILLNPVNARIQRLELIGSAIAIWAALTSLLWGRAKLRLLFLTLPVIAMVLFPFTWKGNQS